MDILFYLLYSTPFLVLSILSRYPKFNIFKISIAGSLLLFYLIVNHLGLVFLYNQDHLGHGNIKIEKGVLLLLAVYSNIVTGMFIIAGFLINVRIKSRDDFSEGETQINMLPIYLLLPVLVFFAFAKFLDSSPLQLLLAGDVHGATVERLGQVSENRTSILGIKHSYIQILFEIGQFVVIFLLISYLKFRRKILLWVFFAYLFLLILFNSSNVSKGIFQLILYITAFVFAEVKNKGNLISFKTIIYLIPFIIGIAYLSGFVLGSEETDFFYPLIRLLVGNLEPQYVIVKNYGFDNLLYELSFPSFFSLGNHTQIDITFIAWQLLGLGEGLDGLFYTAPCSFIGEAHASFHIFGVILFSGVIFIYLRMLDVLINRMNDTLLRSAMLIYLALHYSAMSTVGSIGMIVDYYLWGVLIFVFFFYPRFRLKEFSMRHLKFN